MLRPTRLFLIIIVILSLFHQSKSRRSYHVKHIAQYLSYQNVQQVYIFISNDVNRTKCQNFTMRRFKSVYSPSIKVFLDENNFQEIIHVVNNDYKKFSPDVNELEVRTFILNMVLKGLHYFYDTRYNVFSNFGFDQIPNDVLCLNRNNRHYQMIPGVKGCILIQVDNILYETVRHYPTTIHDLITIIKPLSNTIYFDDVKSNILTVCFIHALLQFNRATFSLQDNPSPPNDEYCLSNIHVSRSLTLRLLICIFPPGRTHRWSTIAEDDYFCPNAYFEGVFIQDAQIPFTTSVFIILPAENVTFQEFCHSEISISPLNIDSNNMVEYQIGIDTTFNCPACKNVPVNDSPMGIQEALAIAVRKTCPVDNPPKQYETYTFFATCKSKAFYNNTVFGKLFFDQMKPMIPCHFQHYVRNNTCSKYMPLSDHRANEYATGGLNSENFVSVFNESQNTLDEKCQMIYVRPQKMCNDPTGHTAIWCSCDQPFCDRPSQPYDVANLVSNKYCAFGTFGLSDKVAEVQGSVRDVACFFQTTFTENRPVIELGFIDPILFKEKFGKLSKINFEVCFNETALMKERCLMSEAYDICCCRINNSYESPCNSLEMAQSMLLTNKLRTADRCTTTLTLDHIDRKMCERKSYTPNICIAVFTFIQPKHEISVKLNREACDHEVLHRTTDVDIVLCHMKRPHILEDKKTECVFMLIHEADHAISAEKPKNRIISCCSTNSYVEKRKKLQGLTFKSYADFKGKN